jgi:hypothetical protein
MFAPAVALGVITHYALKRSRSLSYRVGMLQSANALFVLQRILRLRGETAAAEAGDLYHAVILAQYLAGASVRERDFIYQHAPLRVTEMLSKIEELYLQAARERD